MVVYKWYRWSHLSKVLFACPTYYLTPSLFRIGIFVYAKKLDCLGLRLKYKLYSAKESKLSTGKDGLQAPLCVLHRGDVC